MNIFPPKEMSIPIKAKALISLTRNIRRIRNVLIVGLLFLNNPFLSQACPGRFVNPITDISCMLPLIIELAKINVGEKRESPNPSQSLCLSLRSPLSVPVPGMRSLRISRVHCSSSCSRLNRRASLTSACLCTSYVRFDRRKAT